MTLHQYSLDNIAWLEVQGSTLTMVKSQHFYVTENGKVTLKIVPADDWTIDSSGLTISPLLPTSMKQLTTITFSARSMSVCQYKGNTYVGQSTNSVARVDSNRIVHQYFITHCGPVESTVIYKDRIYIMGAHTSTARTIGVYELSGQCVTQWDHADASPWSNDALIVMADQVLIPDRMNNRVTVYSLTGETLRHIPLHPHPGNTHIAACSVDDTSIIISHYGSSQVLKINIATGDVMWTSKSVSEPYAVTCHRGKYAFVTSCDHSTIIKILCTSTGEL